MTRVFIFAVVLCFASAIQANESHIHSIQRLTLSTKYYSEGAGFGDVPHDPNLLHLYRYAPEPVGLRTRQPRLSCYPRVKIPSCANSSAGD
jgi:hypothetical protein